MNTQREPPLEERPAHVGRWTAVLACITVVSAAVMTGWGPTMRLIAVVAVVILTATTMVVVLEHVHDQAATMVTHLLP